MSSYDPNYLQAYRANFGKNPPDPMLMQPLTEADKAFNKQYQTTQGQRQTTGGSPLSTTSSGNTLNNAQVNQFLASQGLPQVAGTGQAAGLIANKGLSDAFKRFQANTGAITDPATIANINATPQGAGRGVVPMTTEPLHGYEKTGLQQLAGQNTGNLQQVLQQLQGLTTNPQSATAGYMNPLAQGYLQEAGGMVRGSTAPITMEQIQGIANPYAAGMKENLTEAGRRARAIITANQGTRGARSFGDTSQGQQLGATFSEEMKGGREIDYNTFNTALQELARQRGEMQSGGQILGGLGSTAQSVTSSALRDALAAIGGQAEVAGGISSLGRQQALDTLGAGQYIRDYNQRINDKLEADILADAGYGRQNLSDVLEMLKSTYGGTQYEYTPKANALELAGTGVGILGELAKSF